MRTNTRMLVLVAGSAVGALSVAASDARAQGARAQERAQDAAVEEVVVTGSRIVQSGFQAPTPLTVATTEDLQRSTPMSIPNGLNELPQFQGSLSNRNQTTGTASVGNHGNTLDLRNLGPNRTLVLMNGRRVPPSRYQGTVDVNILPEMLVQRVEVVTGGASAVYGSDAVSGVVNYILDNKYTGVKTVIQGGRSTYWDAASYKLGVAAGARAMDDRLHILFSASHAMEDQIWRDDRDPNRFTTAPHGENWAWARSVFTAGAPAAGTAGNPLTPTKGVIGTLSNAAGVFQQSNAGAPRTFNAQGQVIPHDPGIDTGVGTQIGGTGSQTGSHQTLINGLITDQVFGQLAYSVTEDIVLTGQATYGKGIANLNGSQATISRAPIFSGNPFLPAVIQADMTRTNTASVPYNKQLRFEAFPSHQTETTEGWTATLDLSGKITDTWRFNAYYTRGEATLAGIHRGSAENQKLFAALDAVRVTAANVGATGLAIGSIVCNVALTNPGRYPGCTPYNPFGDGIASPASIDYIINPSIYNVDNVSNSWLASIQGEVFNTWAGPVSVAVGAEYRTLSLDVTSNSDPGTPFDIVGIRGITATTTAHSNINIAKAKGENKVKEVFGEVQIPLAKDWALAQSLDLSLAGRRTDYSTSGVVNTWKVGLSWVPVDGMRVRGTLSRDIRAPSLFELFAGGTARLAVTFDPHVQPPTSQIMQVRGGGNPNLKPEDGKTKALGVVFQPSAIPGLSMSVDYYDIRIQGAINAPTSDVIFNECETQGGTGAACALIIRPLPFSNRTPANIATEIKLVPINTAFRANRGVDIEVRYKFDLDRFSMPGSMDLKALVNYVDRYAIQLDSTAPIRELAGTTDGQQPRWRGVFGANWRNGPLSVYGQMQYVGKLNSGPQFVYTVKSLKAVQYFDATITYDAKIANTDTQFFFNVKNIFNKGWPFFPTANSTGTVFPTIVSVYDVLGRYFTVGAKTQF